MDWQQTLLLPDSNEDFISLVSLKMSTTQNCKWYYFYVDAVQPVERINLDKSSISLDALEQHQLKARVYPDNAYNKELEWKSEDETIATVSDSGLVKASKKGKTRIAVMAKDGSGVVSYCDVTVNNNAYVVKSVDEMESAHGYENNSSDFWIYTATEMKTLNVTFDARTNVTLNTPGRIRVAYSELDSNGIYSFDTTNLTGCSIRAYVVYTDTDGNTQIIYSDSIIK